MGDWQAQLVAVAAEAIHEAQVQGATDVYEAAEAVVDALQIEQVGIGVHEVGAWHFDDRTDDWSSTGWQPVFRVGVLGDTEKETR